MATVSSLTPQDLWASDLIVEHVVVPLDGSPESERALGPATVLAGAFGGAVSCISVVDSTTGRDSMQDYYEKLVTKWPQLSWQLPIENDEPSSRIVTEANAATYPLLCMATHGRGRAATSVLGSVARKVLSVWVRPLVVCGPEAQQLQIDQPLLACVDGSAASAGVLRTAGVWAKALGVPLTVLTVAEPTPERLDDGSRYRRAHGPEEDAQPYVDQLAAVVRDTLRIPVQAVAKYDPLSVAHGVRDYCDQHPTSLIVAATRNRRGFGELTLGSQASALARHAPVPVILTQQSGLADG